MSYEIGRWEADVVRGIQDVLGGKDILRVTFKFVEGPNKDKKIDAKLFLTPAALPYSIEKLRTCGWNDAYAGDDFDLTSLPGTRVELNLEQDGDYAEIKYINKCRPPRPSVPGLGAKWRAQIAALPKPEQDFGGADDFKVS